MKKKSQLVVVLDELRSQDPKKRLASLQSLKQVAAAIGPVRTRTQLMQYLQEFVDDDENIVGQLLNQLKDFRAELGGQEHEKQLIPLLINLFKTDQMQQTQKALQLMEPILTNNKDLIVDVVKKLSKTQMNTVKYAAAYLTSRLIQLVPQSENILLQIFSGIVYSEVPQYKIIASKFICDLLDRVKTKQQIGKMLEVIYNDNDDLSKIYAMQALVNYYPTNNNLVVNKFKMMLGLNYWRLNAKICQIVPLCVKVFNKTTFKTTFQQHLVKFFTSPQDQLRAKSCCLFKPLVLVMGEDQVKKTLLPAIKKLSNDPIDYVKISASQNVVSLVQMLPKSLINEELLPIIFTFIKQTNLAIGILKGFQILTKKFNADMIEQKILIPLMAQLNTEDWKVKCQLIDLLRCVISNSFFLNDQLTTTLLHLTEDKINAVRQKATQLIISIICQQSPQWCDSMLIPKLQCLKDSPSYIERQIMLDIIDKTCDKVSQKTLNDVYRQTILNNLSDKVPNVKARALKVIKNNRKIFDKMFEKYVDKLKNDSDAQVRNLALDLLKS